jgi:hypothetical protein
VADNDLDKPDVDLLSNLFGETADLEPTTDFVDAVMARAHASESASLDPEARLAQLFEATAELQPSPSFQVPLPSEADDADRLFAKTASIAPADGFTDAIMGRVSKVQPLGRPGFLEGLGRSSRTAFFAAAAVAAASVGFSLYSESSYDAGVIASVDLMDAGD